MKIRIGFVANSSSSSFLIGFQGKKQPTVKQISKWLQNIFSNKIKDGMLYNFSLQIFAEFIISRIQSISEWEKDGIDISLEKDYPDVFQNARAMQAQGLTPAILEWRTDIFRGDFLSDLKTLIWQKKSDTPSFVITSPFEES